MNLRRGVADLATGLIPAGSIAVAAGVMVNGFATYLFLVLPPRLGGLTADDYASLTRLWFVLFIVAPGLFVPVEQDLTRAIAEARAHGRPTDGEMTASRRFAGLLAVGAASVVGIVAFFLRHRLFGGSVALVVALSVGTVFYAGLHLGRGSLAGFGKFGRYGATFGLEGAIRVTGAVFLIAVGAVSTTTLSTTIVVAAFGAALLAVMPIRRTAVVEQPRAVTDVATSVGALLVATTSALFVANFAPLALAIVHTDHPSAGALSAAVILTRLPMFLYQAVQAALIPEFTQLVAIGKLNELRQRVRQVLIAGALLLGAYATVMVAFGPLLLRLLFGTEFTLARSTLAILSSGSATFILAMITTHALLAIHRNRSLVAQWALATLLAVGFVVFGMRSLNQICVAFAAATTAALIVGVVEVKRSTVRPTTVVVSS